LPKTERFEPSLFKVSRPCNPQGYHETDATMSTGSIGKPLHDQPKRTAMKSKRMHLRDHRDQKEYCPKRNNTLQEKNNVY
jgi:hypothetical protein